MEESIELGYIIEPPRARLKTIALKSKESNEENRAWSQQWKQPVFEVRCRAKRAVKIIELGYFKVQEHVWKQEHWKVKRAVSLIIATIAMEATLHCIVWSVPLSSKESSEEHRARRTEISWLSSHSFVQIVLSVLTTSLSSNFSSSSSWSSSFAIFHRFKCIHISSYFHSNTSFRHHLHGSIFHRYKWAHIAPV